VISSPRKTYRLPLLALFLVFALCGQSAELAPALQGFDRFMGAAMQELHVPGAAVGVIQNGKVLLAKGYGVRGIRSGQPVTPDTIFATGSVTKSFTSSALATLVDEGKLDWDTPVSEYLPWFRLYDPHASQLITLRDMLTHRSGLPRYDSLRFLVKFPREELVRRLRYLPPSRSFREAYQYNNLMYVTAGFIGGQAAGLSWEDLIRTRIFSPLGMTSSTVAVKDTQKASDYAMPHELTNGKPEEVAFYDYQEFGVGPNGAVNSTANDMLRYVQLHLDGGLAGGRQLVSAKQMKQLHQPVLSSGSGTSAYALGWQVDHFAGKLIVQHGGAITGFTAHLTLLPEEKTGIVVLNNLGSALPGIAAEELANRLLGVKDKDLLANLRRRNQSRPAPPPSPKPVPGTKPSLALNAYAGVYAHPAYGSIPVQWNSGDLEIVFPAFPIRLQHYHYDTFSARGLGLVRFVVDEKGKASSVLLPVEQAVLPFVFERVTQ